MTFLGGELGFKGHQPVQKTIVCLWGLTGIGKSQLAANLVSQQRSTYPKREIFWITGEDQESFEQSVINMLKAGDTFHAPQAPARVSLPSEERKRLVNLFFAELNNLGDARWLLVIDGINSIGNDDSVEGNTTSFNIHRLIGGLHRGYVLLTSRRRDEIERYHSCWEMQGLNVEAATSLLRSRVHPSLMQEGIEDLVNLLKGLPLALCLAISIIGHYRCTIREYLDMWNSRSDASETLGTDKALYRSLEMGFEELERSNPIAAKILTVFSFLDHSDLWYDLCYGAIEETYPPWLQNIASEKTPFKRYCPILADRSFIELRVSPSGLRMWETHPAIQAVARDRAKDLELEYTRYAISLVAAAVPRGYEKDSWQKIRRLGPHVKLCWSYFKQGKWGPVANLNELESLGRVFRHLGQYDEALIVYRVIERALILQPSNSSDDTEFLANVLTNLGLVYVRQQKFEQALDSFDRSFNLMQQIGILTPNAFMSVMYNKSVVYMMTERLDQAEELLRDAAAHFSEHTIDEHSLEHNERKELYFRILNDLGEVLLRQGYWQAAMEIFDDVHDCCKSRTGDPILFSLKLNIGRALAALGNFSKARSFFIEVVTVYTEWWGRHHPETMRAIEELAGAFMEDGNQKEAMDETGEVELKSAEELWNEVLGFYRSTDGDESEGVIRIETNLQYLSGLGQPRSPWYLEDSDW